MFRVQRDFADESALFVTVHIENSQILLRQVQGVLLITCALLRLPNPLEKTLQRLWTVCLDNEAVAPLISASDHLVGDHTMSV